MPYITVHLLPEDVVLSSLATSNVVVIDVIRATTIICAALSQGVTNVLPLQTTEEVIDAKNRGYLAVGDIDEEHHDCFDLSKSPRIYSEGNFRGAKVALSTTNGTKTILAMAQAKNLYMGSFLNAQALIVFLGNSIENLIIICAGWKGTYSMEDSLCAGYIATELATKYRYIGANETFNWVVNLYAEHHQDMYLAVLNSEHGERIRSQQLEDDVRFCLQIQDNQTIPTFQNGLIVDNASVPDSKPIP
ncbi:MAG: hypothetical protein RIS47_605 [Bacteroidota bacterium]|jgi:2-phosphosulfolactate phosphatase